MPRRVLVVLVHPALQRSRVNRALAAAAREVCGSTVHDLYEEYPDFQIDPAREQALVQEHDALIFQHPMYWYSAPALLKEWLDIVLARGWAYGDGAAGILGKSVMHAVSTGGPAENYRAGTGTGFTVPELLAPFEATWKLCRARWEPPFVVHRSHDLTPACRDLQSQCAAYAARLAVLAGSDPSDPSP